MFKRIYQQNPNSPAGEPGDCFACCLASLFGVPLGSVPNFMYGTDIGKLLPKQNQEYFREWLKKRGCAYVEFGWEQDPHDLIKMFGEDNPDAVYLLTANTWNDKPHTVVARGATIIHDPATSLGRQTLMGPCRDGFTRIGLILHYFPNVA